MKVLDKLLPRLSFNATVRMRVWKKLAAQTRNGLNLDQSIRQMQKRADLRRLQSAKVYSQALEYLGLGHNLGACLTGYASPEEIMLISSGQRSGKLPEGLELAASLLAARQSILRAITSALAYPVFLVAMIVVVLLVLSIMVMPKFAMLSDPSAWHGAAALLYATTSFVTSPMGLATLLAVLALLAASLVTLPSWTGQYRMLVENLPPWSIYRLTVGCVWLFTVSTLMRAGMQLTHILENMASSDHVQPYLRERILAVSIEVGTGKNFGESLYSCGMGFPDEEMIDDLRVYASLPGFHLRMHELASEWMNQGVELVKQQARVINLLAILVLTGLVGLLAAAIGSLQSQLLPSGGF